MSYPSQRFLFLFSVIVVFYFLKQSQGCRSKRQSPPSVLGLAFFQLLLFASVCEALMVERVLPAPTGPLRGHLLSCAAGGLVAPPTDQASSFPGRGWGGGGWGMGHQGGGGEEAASSVPDTPDPRYWPPPRLLPPALRPIVHSGLGPKSRMSLPPSYVLIPRTWDYDKASLLGLYCIIQHSSP